MKVTNAIRAALWGRGRHCLIKHLRERLSGGPNRTPQTKTP